MSLPRKYVNLKEPYNEDIKEQVTTKNFKIDDGLYMKSPNPEKQCVEGVFQIQFPVFGVNFSNNIDNKRRRFVFSSNF